MGGALGKPWGRGWSPASTQHLTQSAWSRRSHTAETQSECNDHQGFQSGCNKGLYEKCKRQFRVVCALI